MSKPLEQRSYIQLSVWITPDHERNLKRIIESAGTTRSEAIRGLLSGKFTVTPAPTDTGPDREAERQQAH